MKAVFHRLVRIPCHAWCFSLFGLFLQAPRAAEWRAVEAFGGGTVTSLCRSGSVLYTASAYAGTYASADEGATWQPMADKPPMVEETTFMAGNDASVFAGSIRELYRFRPGQGSWLRLDRSLPINPSNLYMRRVLADGTRLTILGDFSNSPIYLSKDDGDTWAGYEAKRPGDMFGLSLRDIAIHGLVCYAATTDSVYSTPQLGMTWTVRLGLPTGAVLYRMEGGESGLWAGTSKGLLFCAWPLLEGGGVPAWTVKPAKGIPANRSAVQSLMEKGGHLWVGTSGGAFHSSDGGDNFRMAGLPDGETYGRVTGMAWQGSGAVLGTYGEGVMAGDIAGNSRLLNAGMRNRTVTSVISYRGELHSLVEDLGCFTSKDGGRLWEGPQPGIAAGPGKGAFFVLEDGLYLVQGSGVFRYDIARRVFEALGVVGQRGNVSSLVRHKGKLMAGTMGGGVYQSLDSGRTWGRARPDPWDNSQNLAGLSVLAMASSGKELYATARGTYRSYLYVFKEDSLQWKTLPNTGAGNQDFMSVQAMGDTLFAGGSYNVNRSVDGGNTWTPLTALPGNANYVDKLLFNDGVLIASSLKAAAFSRDRGLTWDSLPSLGVTVTCGVPIEHGLIVGTRGASMWRYFPAGAPPDGIRKPDRGRLARNASGGAGYRLFLDPAAGPYYRTFPPGAAISLLGRSLPASGRARAPILRPLSEEAP